MDALRTISAGFLICICLFSPAQAVTELSNLSCIHPKIFATGSLSSFLSQDELNRTSYIAFKAKLPRLTLSDECKNSFAFNTTLVNISSDTLSGYYAIATGIVWREVWMIEPKGQGPAAVWIRTALYHGDVDSVKRQTNKMLDDLITLFSEAYYLAENQ